MTSLSSEVEQGLTTNERYVPHSFDHIVTKNHNRYTMVLYKYKRSMFSLPGQIRAFFGCTIFEQVDNEFFQIAAAGSALERINEKENYTHLLRGYGVRENGTAILFICGIVENPIVSGVQVDFPNAGVLHDTIENRAFGVASYNDKIINRLTILGINGSVIDEIYLADDTSLATR